MCTEGPWQCVQKDPGNVYRRTLAMCTGGPWQCVQEDPGNAALAQVQLLLPEFHRPDRNRFVTWAAPYGQKYLDARDTNFQAWGGVGKSLEDINGFNRIWEVVWSANLLILDQPKETLIRFMIPQYWRHKDNISFSCRDTMASRDSWLA